MLTQGLITTVYSDQLYDVRIPVFETIYSGVTIIKAHMTNIPGTYIKLNIGDTVWVGFERNLADKPVILGLITQKYNDSAKIGIKADTLEVSNSATIPYATNISNSISGYSSIKDIITNIETWKTQQINYRRNVFGLELDDMYTYRLNQKEYTGKKYFGQTTLQISPNVINGQVDEFSITSDVAEPINLNFTCYNKDSENRIHWYDPASIFRFKVEVKDKKVTVKYTILDQTIVIPGSNWVVNYELTYAN